MSPSPDRWETGSTGLIVLLSAVPSLIGLLRDGHYADHAGSLSRIYAQDVVLLVLAVPVLAGSLWFARRGSIRGRIT